MHVEIDPNSTGLELRANHTDLCCPSPTNTSTEDCEMSNPQQQQQQSSNSINNPQFINQILVYEAYRVIDEYLHTLLKNYVERNQKKFDKITCASMKKTNSLPSNNPNDTTVIPFNKEEKNIQFKLLGKR